MIVLINHQNDLDGLGSQAILKRYFDKLGVEIKLLFALYPEFLDRIQEAIKIKPKQIVIADIGFNDSFNQAFPLIKKAMEDGIKVSWYDHHQVDEKTQTRLKELLKTYYNDPSSCAAQIVCDHFLPNDPVAKEIAKYAYDADYNEKKFPISQELQMAIANNRDNIDNLKRIVDLISKGLFTDKFIQDEIASAQEELIAQSEKIKKNYRHFVIESGKMLAFSYSDFSASKISRFLESEFPENDIFMGLDERSGEVVIRSNNYNCKEIAKKYGGGGHVGRAGFSTREAIIKSKEDELMRISIKQTFIDEFIKTLKT